MQNSELEYVGFWARVGASLIDAILVGVITLPILLAYYGESYWYNDAFIKGPFDFLMSQVFPAVAIVIFWVAKQASPGKMAISAKIVDAKTGGIPTTTQYIFRYLAYFVSIIPLCLGLIWVAFDSRKQGWHDKLAGTIVVRPKNRRPRPVSFDSKSRY